MRKMEYDAERTRVLNAYGLSVIRYTNSEVLCNSQGVYQHLIKAIAIKHEMPSSSPDKGRLGGVSSA